MLTFQDFLKEPNKKAFIAKAIQEHKGSAFYQTAKTADLYDRQLNETINNYVKMIFSLTGTPMEDFTASNAKIASNFFHRLNTQRCTYSLGNGISFTKKQKQIDADGKIVTVDQTKNRLGPTFDTDIKKAGYYAIIHGVSFCFVNVNRVHVFPVTEFVPLWDERSGALKAGVRFWQLDTDKPMSAVLYEEDGYTKFVSENGNNITFAESQAKKAYKTRVAVVEATGESSVIGEENYGRLPIVPFWGSQLHQSTIVGMRQSIDSFDLIRSGFANDLTDCAQIYWIVDNCGGMSQAELQRFRDRMKINHIVVNDADSGSKITPYAQEIPYAARKEYLDHIRAGIYEDFGGLDVHTVAAGATNDHIDAAYQPMDENADDFEFQAIECIQQILEIIGIEDTPIFKRNRISNQREQVEMVMLEAPYLDDETILQKLPNISPDEVQEILSRKLEESSDRIESEVDIDAMDDQSASGPNRAEQN